MADLARLVVDQFRRVPPIIFRYDDGILSATDERYFIGFQLLYCSLQERHAPLMAVIDLGMNASQRYWCKQQKRLLVIKPIKDYWKLVGCRYWQQWNKPYYLTLSPFRRTLWLDSDTIVLNDLCQIWRLLDMEPFIVNGSSEYLVAHDWIADGTRQTVFVPPGVHVPSTAVLGIDMVRDWWLIFDWLRLLEEFDQEWLSSSLSGRALGWVLAKNQHLELPTDNPAWNWSILRHWKGKNDLIVYNSAAELLVSVKSDYPLAHILHFEGPMKPWLAWPEMNEAKLDLGPVY